MKKLVYIIFSALLFFFILIVYAQVSQTIDIRNFKGVITNADLEDIPAENFVELKNLRPVNGKLVKTFEFGINNYPVKPTLFANLYNLVNWINPYLINPDDYDPLIYAVTSTDTAYVAYWNSLSASWVYLGFPETFVHSQSTNPVIQADGIIRFLPGAVGSIGGRQAKGMILFFSDSVWVFDHNYQRPGPSAFIGYRSSLDSLGDGFSLSVTTTKLDSGTFIDGKNYRYSLNYDGVQEGLLKDLCNIYYSNNQFGKIKLNFNATEINKRITGINIYRSDNADSIYNIIHTIDFLRDSTEIIYTDSIYNGLRYIHIPELITYTFVAGRHYYIRIYTANMDNYTDYNIIDPVAGTGKDVFCDSVSTNKVGSTIWNRPWGIYWQGCDTIFTYNILGGSYGGSYVIITDKNTEKYNLGGGVLILKYSNIDTISYRIIDFNTNKAIHFKGDSALFYYPNKCIVVSPTVGNYYFTKDSAGTNEGYTFFDTDLTPGAEHSLAGEVSINVNGKYAKIIGNRLWQGNIVLDPGGKNEVHNDWISYSEIGQYDVNPVSNVISFANQGVGKITGIGELFGYPVIIKKNNVSLINIKDYPTDPAKWNIIESVHNIGNISTNGIITVLGHIYLPYYDGIYEFAPNELAESSTTPSRIMKITEPIDDKYLALTLTQKEGIISEYNQKYNEIIFKFGTELWAYSLLYKTWRELDIQSFTPTYWCLDQNANILAYNSTDSSFYNSDSTGSTRAYLQSKTFSIADERAKPIRAIWLTYKGHASADLQLKLYLDNSTTAYNTWNISTVDSIKTERIDLKISAKKFNFVIQNPSYSIYETQIYRIKIECEAEQ